MYVCYVNSSIDINKIVSNQNAISLKPNQIDLWKPNIVGTLIYISSSGKSVNIILIDHSAPSEFLENIIENIEIFGSKYRKNIGIFGSKI